MKKNIKFIVICYFMFMFLFNHSFISSADSNIKYTNNKILNEEVSFYIKHNDIFLYSTNQSEIIINYHNEEKIVNGKYISYTLYNEFIYVLVIFEEDYYCYKIDSNNLKITKIKLDIEKANEIRYIDNYIYIIGMKDLNPYIGKYDLNIKEIDYNTIQSDGYVEYTCIEYINNYIYVGGIKDAICNNETFKNVGNNGDIKSFIFKFDIELKVVDSCYFNEDFNNETIVSLIPYNNNLSILLKADKLYQYEITLDFKVVNRYIIKTFNIREIKTDKQKNNTHLYIYQDSYFTNICVYLNDKIRTIIYQLEGYFVDYYIKNGELYIYYNYDNKLYLRKISEHHTEYINPLVCDYYNYDETKTNHFLVDSYFEDLEFKIYSISPYFERNMPGDYTAKYMSIKQNSETIFIETPLIVKPYLNIIDGGIYNLGTRLFFFGSGKLNDQNIINGTPLTKEGPNKLEITNANNETFTYNFNVVNNYYNTDTSINIEYNFLLKKNDTILIPLGDKLVEYVVVNGEELRNIRLVNDIYYLEILPKNIKEIENYLIEDMYLDDGTIININQNIIIKNQKEDVYFNIFEYSENNLFNLDIETTDNNKNIKDIYIEVYIDDQLVNIVNTFIKDKKDLFYGLNNNIKILVIAETYTLGNITLFSYEGKIKKSIDLLYEINFMIENERIKNIYISLDLSNHLLTHKSFNLLGIKQNDLINKYQVNKSYSVLFISTIISVILIIILIIVIIKKRHKLDDIEI